MIASPPRPLLARIATKDTENDCGPQVQKKIRGDREIGYLAQPLYGVWASAPYFHNGSVPNVWEVLKPQDRYPIWRRVSAPRAEGEGNVVMGFDTNLQRAFDAEKMGWKYDRIQCESLPPMVAPGFNCRKGRGKPGQAPGRHPACHQAGG